MDKIIDILKRVGSDISKERKEASIVSINYVDGSSLYGTSRNGIDYEIAQKLVKGNKYLDYNTNMELCTVYNIKEKIIDKYNNIILIADESERITFEDSDED